MKTNNEKIIAILSNAKKEELDGMGNGWVNMANLGKPLLDAGIIIEDYGLSIVFLFYSSGFVTSKVCSRSISFGTSSTPNSSSLIFLSLFLMILFYLL